MRRIVVPLAPLFVLTLGCSPASLEPTTGGSSTTGASGSAGATTTSSTTANATVGTTGSSTVGTGETASGAGGSMTSGGAGESSGSGGGSGASDSGAIGDAVAPSDAVVTYDSSASNPGTAGDGVREIGPGFKRDPETQSKTGVPHGKIVNFTIPANSSKIFPKAPNRPVAVYVPTQYVSGMPAPVMVVQDGQNFYGFVGYLSAILDNFISEKKLPPIVVVFANNGGGDAQGSERGLEYDTLSGVYAEWADQELLPMVEMQTKTLIPAQAVTFTHDPEGRGSVGGSSGGIAAFSMTWWQPDLFRRSISFSGTFVAQESPKNPAHPLGGWNYHEDQDLDDGGLIAKEPSVKPIRAWLECGTNDDGSGSPATSHYNFELANQRMELKLAGKGYHVHLDHAAGAGHVDQGVIGQTLAEAMLWVWRGYPGVAGN